MIYIITVVTSEELFDGRESFNLVSNNFEKIMAKAYDYYTYYYSVEENFDGLSEEEIEEILCEELDFATFKKEIVRKKYICISFSDYHYQFEYSSFTESNIDDNVVRI